MEVIDAGLLEERIVVDVVVDVLAVHPVNPITANPVRMIPVRNNFFIGFLLFSGKLTS